MPKYKHVTRKHDASKSGPKEPPSQVQLPGGVTIKSFPFRITSVDAQGRPLTFERARGNEDQDCVLWGTAEFLDAKLPANLDARFRKRIEDSIEGLPAPDLVKSSRVYEDDRMPMNPTNYAAMEKQLSAKREPAHAMIDLPGSTDLAQQLLARGTDNVTLCVGDRQAVVKIMGKTPAGTVQLLVDDWGTLQLLKQGTVPVSIGSTVKEEEVTCGYEPCDNGPCLRPEAHAARENAERDADDE